MLHALALQLWKGVLASFAHQAQGIDIHRALEEVEEGDDGEFVVVEGVVEAVVERGAEGLVAALLFVCVLDVLLAAADGFDEVFDLSSSVQAGSDRLADEYAERERVAGAVVEEGVRGGDL